MIENYMNKKSETENSKIANSTQAFVNPKVTFSFH